MSVSSVRVAVAGDVAVGKSTLIQVLSHGDNDCPHPDLPSASEPVESVHIGYTSLSPPTVVPASDLSAAKVVQLLSLSGDLKSLKLSLHAMTSMCPDYMLLLIDSTVGVTATTRQFMGLAIAMRLQIVVVITKTDVCDPPELQARVAEVQEWVFTCTHKPVQLISTDAKQIAHRAFIPLLLVSTETKQGIGRLHDLLSGLSPEPGEREKEKEGKSRDPKRPSCAEVLVRQIHNLPHLGLVVVGLLRSGRLRKHQTLYLGPVEGAFRAVIVEGIQVAGAERSICQGPIEVAIQIVAKDRRPFDTDKLVRQKALTLVAKVDPQRLAKAFDAVVIALGHGSCNPGSVCTVFSGPTRKSVRIIELIGQTALLQGEKGGVKFEYLEGCAYMSPGDFAIFSDNGISLLGVVTQLYPCP